jgi:murein DD-endopeptidase MepM/ murein hydrolase activator NlpD
LPDDRHVFRARRADRARPRPTAFRATAATVLAVPVIALVIGESLIRRVGRPAIVVVLLLTGTVTAFAFSTTSIGARSATTPAPLVADQFHPVVISRPPTTSGERAAVGVIAPEATPGPTPAATPAPEAPTVIRFRPRDGWTGVSRFAAVSVRFSRPMDHATTERAFHVTMGQTPVTGTVNWAEGDTVLVLDPRLPLPYRARVTLAVAPGAHSAEGAPLRAARSVTFTVQSRPTPAVQATPSPSRRPAPSSAAWRWPLIGPITQKFGETKTQYGFHQGIDIDGNTGDRVRAARGGRVVVAGTFDSCGGLQVHIDHGDGFESWYRHLSRIDVKPGDVVAAGVVIGRVGDTGCSLGSHLHFGIRRGATFVDPLRYLPPR